MTGVPSSTPTSAPSSAENAQHWVRSIRPVATFLPLTKRVPVPPLPTPPPRLDAPDLLLTRGRVPWDLGPTVSGLGGSTSGAWACFYSGSWAAWDVQRSLGWLTVRQRRA